MEQEPNEDSLGAENISTMVDRGRRYLDEQNQEMLQGLENIRPEVIMRAQEILFALGA